LGCKNEDLFESQRLWDLVETGSNPRPLQNNPTLAQTRNHNDEVAK